MKYFIVYERPLKHLGRVLYDRLMCQAADHLGWRMYYDGLCVQLSHPNRRKLGPIWNAIDEILN